MPIHINSFGGSHEQLRGSLVINFRANQYALGIGMRPKEGQGPSIRPRHGPWATSLEVHPVHLRALPTDNPAILVYFTACWVAHHTRAQEDMAGMIEEEDPLRATRLACSQGSFTSRRGRPGERVCTQIASLQEVTVGRSGRAPPSQLGKKFWTEARGKDGILSAVDGSSGAICHDTRRPSESTVP